MFLFHNFNFGCGGGSGWRGRIGREGKGRGGICTCGISYIIMDRGMLFVSVYVFGSVIVGIG